VNGKFKEIADMHTIYGVQISSLIKERGELQGRLNKITLETLGTPGDTPVDTGITETSQKTM
jgi:hypothetical protein